MPDSHTQPAKMGVDGGEYAGIPPTIPLKGYPVREDNPQRL